MNPRIQAISARVAAATEGPLTVRMVEIALPKSDDVDEFALTHAVFDEDDWCVAEHLSKADADFIAHARSDVPWLLAQLDSYAREVAALREVIERTGPKYGVTWNTESADAIALERDKEGV